MGYIKTLPLPPPRCRSVPHQLPPASAVCIIVYRAYGMVGVFTVPAQITRNSKVGYGQIWTGHHRRNSERISEIAVFSRFGISVLL